MIFPPNILTTGEYYNNIISERQVFEMAELASLNIKIDRNLKSQADMLFNAMGMTLTTAVNVFVRQAVQEQAIPFTIRLDSDKLVAQRAKEALKEAQEQAIINGTADMTIDDIDNEIQAYRQENRCL